MATFVSLEEAAKRLGLSTDQLIEMRSRGEIFGYRDGTSWKFKPEEMERVASEMLGDVLDEDPAGSSILSLESEHSSSLSGLSSSSSGFRAGESDVSLQVEPGGSDLKLVASSGISLGEPAEGSGLSQIDEDGLQLASSDDDDDELSLASDDDDQVLSDIEPSPSPKSSASPSANSASSDLNLIVEGSDLDISLSSDDQPNSDGSSQSSELGLAGDSGKRSASAKDELIKGDSDPALATNSSGVGSDLDLADDLQLEDDLVLSDGSDLALGADSGINLRSPGDSGISLEDDSLGLDGSGISGLDLSDAGSDPGSGVSGGLGSGSGSGVNFQQDEDFQLSPSGGTDAEDDSGSQVIELEDSSEFGEGGDAQPGSEAFDAFGEVTDDADVFGQAAPGVAGAVMSSPEVPYSLLQVLLLMGVLLIMAFSGILMSDVVRNLWAWSGTETNGLTSGFTEMLVGIFN